MTRIKNFTHHLNSFILGIINAYIIKLIRENIKILLGIDRSKYLKSSFSLFVQLLYSVKMLDEVKFYSSVLLVIFIHLNENCLYEFLI